MSTNQPQNTEGGPSSAPASQNQEVRNEILEFVKMVVWFVILFILLRQFVVEGYEVYGPSMEPTLEASERILVFKLPLYLGMEIAEPGDIIVFESPEEGDMPYVKRVVATGPAPPKNNRVKAGGGEDAIPPVPVQIDEGTLYVNNVRVEENYLPPDASVLAGSAEEVDLQPNEYYVLGDNRARSKDSRRFGAVARDHVVGRAVFRFWPLSKISILR